MSNDRAAQSGEDRLIARYFAPLAKHPGAFGLADDAAALAPPAGCDLVLKADGIVAGVHFFPDDPPDTVAKKALRANLSDLAAKGATPLGFLLTLALPREIGDAWLAPFARGLGADAEAFGCPLLGGDTDSTTGPIMISIAALGAVPQGKMLRRAGASAGDRVVVTGTIGDAALGLLLRNDMAAAERWSLGREASNNLQQRYLVPQPRLAIAEILRAHASAAMDVSDGLAGDLAKLCRASAVNADIEVARVPLSAGARAALAKEPALIETIITGGDDYEVLACVPADKIETLRQQASAAGVPISEIGVVAAGEGGARFLGSDGEPLAFSRKSFSHF
ncbi:MAG: thiamine-phosphate kinase [Alphaproteobacteria bacterium]|nr:MAG: thiamine-phosphate kinase [Alphaproteobacteria bacterium]